jgi:regulator of RNase E activity RraA
MPGDVIVGDAEGVVVIPAKMAEEVAHDAYEQELREEFFQQKVANGASILGVYPPNEETLAEFESWRQGRA